MPATYTHAVFGEKVLKQLDPDLRSCIERHRDCYDIGLSGPDILFFYHPLSANPVKNQGHAMHWQAARSFFENARKLIAQSEDPEAALAYVLGFINHFVLDSQCHPLINKVTAAPPITHSELESELDAYWMRQQGKDVIRTKVTAHLRPSAQNERIIASFFALKPKQIRTALTSMIRILDWFVAPGKIKRGVLKQALRVAGIYDEMHGLIFNSKPNPLCTQTVMSLVQKMEDAVPISVRLIEEYCQLLNSDRPLDARYDLNYE